MTDTPPAGVPTVKKFISLVCESAHETISLVCNVILVSAIVEAVFGTSDN